VKSTLYKQHKRSRNMMHNYYTHIYVYINIHTYILTESAPHVVYWIILAFSEVQFYICMYTSRYINIYIYIHITIYIYICVYIYIYIYIYIYQVYIYIYIYIHWYIHSIVTYTIHEYLFALLYIQVENSSLISTERISSPSAYIYICYTYIYVYIYIHIYICSKVFLHTLYINYPSKWRTHLWSALTVWAHPQQYEYIYIYT
jgi:hypothetical protein